MTARRGSTAARALDMSTSTFFAVSFLRKTKIIRKRRTYLRSSIVTQRSVLTKSELRFVLDLELRILILLPDFCLPGYCKLLTGSCRGPRGPRIAAGCNNAIKSLDALQPARLPRRAPNLLICQFYSPARHYYAALSNNSSCTAIILWCH